MALEFDDHMEYEISPLEYMIRLGARGSHVLFETDRIREAFEKEEEELVCLGAEQAEDVRDALRNVLAISEIEDKRDFLSSLPREIQYVLIHLYFQMIERTVHLDQKAYH